MERIQSLKHRENLIKGMGITDFVNRILYGTSGTMATVPPSLQSHSHNSKNTNGTIVSKNLISTIPNQDMSLQVDPMNRTLTTYNPKIEIKTKNYNPFENQALFSEVNELIFNLNYHFVDIKFLRSILPGNSNENSSFQIKKFQIRLLFFEQT